MSGATETQTQTLEETLNKTDFGHWLYEYRKLFFGVILAVLVGVTGFLVWRQSKHSSALNHSVKVFEFQTGIWTDVKSGKTGIPELVKAFDSLEETTRQAPVMIPLALEMGKFLSEKGANAEAEDILSKVSAQTPVGLFFVSMQRYVVLEKLGKTDEAISVLEKLASNKETLMPARVFVELGRLYKTKGDKGKAQTQFDYVMSNYPNDEQAKLAKLYLAELAGK